MSPLLRWLTPGRASYASPGMVLSTARRRRALDQRVERQHDDRAPPARARSIARRSARSTSGARGRATPATCAAARPGPADRRQPPRSLDGQLDLDRDRQPAVRGPRPQHEIGPVQRALPAPPRARALASGAAGTRSSRRSSRSPDHAVLGVAPLQRGRDQRRRRSRARRWRRSHAPGASPRTPHGAQPGAGDRVQRGLARERAAGGQQAARARPRAAAPAPRRRAPSALARAPRR